jgi:hypothetical protein
MTYSAFVGCSYTQGTGLAEESLDQDLWINIVYSSLLKKDTKLLNLGISGSNNADIFYNAINAVLTHQCRYLFVQWTELHRLKINPGIETYPTSLFFSPNITPGIDITINPDITYDKKYINNIKNRFFDLQHDHYAIVKVLEYSKVIKKLCDRLKIPVFFVNGILPWDKNYFETVCHTTRLPSDTTAYTQKQLNASTRDDQEYFLLYDKIHHDYQELDFTKDRWLNLYLGFRKCFYLDQALDDLHPGIISNRQFAEHIIENLQGMLTK